MFFRSGYPPALVSPSHALALFLPAADEEMERWKKPMQASKGKWTSCDVEDFTTIILHLPFTCCWTIKLLSLVTD
jgi:hypothetical protein